MREIQISLVMKIALKSRDVHGIEEELLRHREAIFLQAFQQAIERIEEDVERREGVCSECGGRMVRNGRAPRRLKTLLGEIRFMRGRLRCLRCGKERFPVDEAMKLEEGESVTLGVRERSLWAAAEVSFEKAHQFLEKFTGLEVSGKKIFRMGREEGERIEEWEEARRREVFEEGKGVEDGRDGPETLYIQVDGTMVNDRGEKGRMECKVGTSYSRRAQVSKGRWWLVDKKVYASIEKAEAFGEKFYLDCVRQGVERAGRVYFISDGALWIRRLQADYFPQAIGVLDLWHLERELREALGEEHEEELGDLKQLALQGQGEEIARRLILALGRGESIREGKIRDAWTYVINNLDWIKNIPLLGGYGSGPVEKTVDITVCRRFKKRGMSWHRQGVNPLMRLRVLKLNGDWDRYWNDRGYALASAA